MGSFWPLVLSLLFSAQVFAQADQAFQFRGQANEHVELKRILNETRHRTEMQDSTCERQIPYQVNECRNETRYRQECHWRDSYEDCSGTRGEQRCENVTRYRRECRDGGSEQRCETTPSREVCNDQPGREVCRTAPDRQVCENGPDRQICQDRPDREVCTERNGERRCSTIPGGRDCRTVPGERQCHTVPGERTCQWHPGERVCRTIPGERQCRTVQLPDICRDVPYQDTECRTVQVPYCRTVPGENVCDSIPYQERVCEDVTRYRTEQYACQRPVQVPYQVQVPMTAQVDVKFLNSFDGEVPFLLKLLEGKTLQLSTTAGQEILVAAKSGTADVTQQNDSILIKQSFDVKLLKATELRAGLTNALTQTFIRFIGKEARFEVNGKIEATDVLTVKVEGKKGTSVTKVEVKGTIAQLNGSLKPIAGGKTAVIIDLKQQDLTQLKKMDKFMLYFTHAKPLEAGYTSLNGVEIRSQTDRFMTRSQY